MAQARSGVVALTPGHCRPFHFFYFHLITSTFLYNILHPKGPEDEAKYYTVIMQLAVVAAKHLMRAVERKRSAQSLYAMPMLQ